VSLDPVTSTRVPPEVTAPKLIARTQRLEIYLLFFVTDLWFYFGKEVCNFCPWKFKLNFQEF